MPSTGRLALASVIGLISVLALAGCLGGAPGAGETASQTPLVACSSPTEASPTSANRGPTASATPAEVGTRTARQSSPTTTPSPESTGTPGAQFYVVVSAVTGPDARRDLCNADPDDRAVFETLPEAKRQEFLTALEQGRARADAWTAGPLYVRYDGSWYRVTIVIEQ